MAVLLLLQVPPDVASANVVVALTQSVVAPVTPSTAGNGFTVTAWMVTAVPQVLVIE